MSTYPCPTTSKEASGCKSEAYLRRRWRREPHLPLLLCLIWYPSLFCGDNFTDTHKHTHTHTDTKHTTHNTQHTTHNTQHTTHTHTPHTRTHTHSHTGTHRRAVPARVLLIARVRGRLSRPHHCRQTNFSKVPDTVSYLVHIRLWLRESENYTYRHKATRLSICCRTAPNGPVLMYLCTIFFFEIFPCRHKATRLSICRGPQ